MPAGREGLWGTLCSEVWAPRGGRGRSQALTPISGLSGSILSLQRIGGWWDITVEFPVAWAQERLFA